MPSQSTQEHQRYTQPSRDWEYEVATLYSRLWLQGLWLFLLFMLVLGLYLRMWIHSPNW